MSRERSPPPPYSLHQTSSPSSASSQSPPPYHPYVGPNRKLVDGILERLARERFACSNEFVDPGLDLLLAKRGRLVNNASKADLFASLLDALMDYDRGKHSKVELFKTLISKFTDKTCIDLIRDIARFMPGDWAIMMPDMKPGCKVCVRMGKLAKMEEWGTLPKTLRR